MTCHSLAARTGAAGRAAVDREIRRLNVALATHTHAKLVEIPKAKGPALVPYKVVIVVCERADRDRVRIWLGERLLPREVNDPEPLVPIGVVGV